MVDWALSVESLRKTFRVPRAEAGRDGDPRRERFSRRHDRFHALRGVSLRVAAGETLGLVGPNGSGKSTLLKILAGVMKADSGRFEVRGRVGALLELGAGFHPDLTGIENVHLNGALLGMRRGEVDRLIPGIIAFAELERFMDMPVRHYSSGMVTRLGFAMATQLAPDVLLMDETFAAGDAPFQAKALAHVAALKAGGCTLLLVSHNMEILLHLADRVMWLDRGAVARNGPTRDVLAEYRREGPLNLEQTDHVRSGLGVTGAFDAVAPEGAAAVRIARATLAVEDAPIGLADGPDLQPPASSLQPLAIRTGQTLRVGLEFAHAASHPDRVWIEAAWVRDDDRILAQSRSMCGLAPGASSTRAALRFRPWELTEGQWRLVLAVSPPEAPRDGAVAWRHYDRLEATTPLRVVTPGPFGVRVAVAVPCRWTI